MKKTKKLVLLGALAVIAIALIAGGTLAWFTDTDNVKNVFTVGDIDIEQNEVFDENVAHLLPIIDNDNPTIATNMIQKEVDVKNIGQDDAYVQVLVAVPACLDNTAVLHIYSESAAANDWTRVDGNAAAEGIQPVYVDQTVAGETMKYNVYIYRYNKAIVKDEVTSKAISGVFLDEALDKKEVTLADGTVAKRFVTGNAAKDAILQEFDPAGKLNVYVATQGVQARGFANAEAALSASFDSAYPITAE
jgi:predicted ribosomally synthesized peptide with SipW-like signal peptide